MPLPLAAPSSLRLASFVGHGGAPHRGVPHHTTGAASHSLELTHTVVVPPQPPVNRPACCHLSSVRARGHVGLVRHETVLLSMSMCSPVGRWGHLGSHAKSCAPVAPALPRAGSRARMRALCGPTSWLPGPTQPGHAGRARPASFACELGREADFWSMTRMENVNPLFFSEISLKLIQTSKIHIKFISCPKIMKSILLFI
jgi:hypothetical protein